MAIATAIFSHGMGYTKVFANYNLLFEHRPIKLNDGEGRLVYKALVDRAALGGGVHLLYEALKVQSSVFYKFYYRL